VAKKRGRNTTKYEIVCCAAKLFIEHGFSATSPKMICDLLNISTGNLTYYFPTKEHLLLEMVTILCDYQWRHAEDTQTAGKDPLEAVCIEVMAMVAMCDVHEIARDFFVAAYSSPLCLEAIRQNDIRRAKDVFASYCAGWTDEDYQRAETLISGIEYGAFMTTASSPEVRVRIAGAIEAVLIVYGVPEERRHLFLQKILALDYVAIGWRVLDEFRLFTEQNAEYMLDYLINLHYDQ